MLDVCFSVLVFLCYIKKDEGWPIGQQEERMRPLFFLVLEGKQFEEEWADRSKRWLRTSEC